MKRVTLAFLIVALPFSLDAGQLSHPVMASRADAPASPRRLLAQPDTVRILAAMVQFQADNDVRTSGNGLFDLGTPQDPSIIEASPHDARYFRDHLQFLANYYRKSSKGKVVIESTLLESIVTLGKQMAAYSPPRGGPNTAVGTLALEAWQRVDSLGQVPDFSRYSCFVLFHAGVGHDIDLVASLGYDPSPLDIPSLYIGLNAFRSYFGPTFNGIPVALGAFQIPNTIVIPETESRFVPGIGGDVLLELSINGLLCSSVGNFLGLPDLFDTNTGRSGIGRFGLMDGQAIFSFGGCFPPEPSAWEKQWLGWVDPITVTTGTDTLTLPAVALADTVYRIPISAREYFLLENRSRDPQRNGQTVTTVTNGVTRQITFPRDTAGFNAVDISSLSGTVIDVEDLDWSLPGGVDQAGTFYDGGILLWHVDETVIARAIGTNGVNADPAHRGVDLEEADGSQDIGEQYGFFSAGSGSEEGTALDFWFKGNSSPVNTNEFSATTHPSSDAYSGARSHVTIRNFSTRGPRMSAVVAAGDPRIAPLPGFPRSVGATLVPAALTSAPLIPTGPNALIVTTSASATLPPRPATPLVPADSRIFAWGSDGTPALNAGTSRGILAVASAGAHFVSGPSFADLNGDGTPELVTAETGAPGGASRIKAWSGRVDGSADSLAAPFFDVPVARVVTTPIVVGDSTLAFGTTGGRVFFCGHNGVMLDSVLVAADSTAAVTALSRWTASGTYVAACADGTVRIVSRGAGPLQAARIGHAIAGVATAKVGQGVSVGVTTADGMVFLLDEGFAVMPGFPVATGDSISAPPAFADLDADGVNDIIVYSGGMIHVLNRVGVALDHFPVRVRSGLPLTSAPVIGDVDGDGRPDIVAVSGDGLVAAIDAGGMMVGGFPLQAGEGGHGVALVDLTYPRESTERRLALVVTSSGDGSVSGWEVGSTQGGGAGTPNPMPWCQYQHDARRSGLDTSTVPGVARTSDFFPAGRAYNWPNPVYDGVTHLRYYVRDDATVKITIFDIAGDQVASLTGPGVGGMDNEVVWNVSGVQSGIYFARIAASGIAGGGIAATGTVVVKVAVVK
jgi:hypothetical protein